MQYEIALNKVRKAVMILTQESETVQERMAQAYYEALRMVRMEDLPLQHREGLATIYRSYQVTDPMPPPLTEAQVRLLVAITVELYEALLTTTE